jgi:SnoaL-like domain
MEPSELVIREACRDAIAQYTHAGDRYMLEELAAAFCEDGTLETRGNPPVVGRRAIIERLSGGRGTTDAEIRAQARSEQAAGGPRRIVRHNITNIQFEAITPTEARVNSYFTVFTEIGLDHMGRYRDRFVPVGEQWRIAHRFVSVDWYSPTSRFASS